MIWMDSKKLAPFVVDPYLKKISPGIGLELNLYLAHGRTSGGPFISVKFPKIDLFTYVLPNNFTNIKGNDFVSHQDPP